MFLDDEPPFSGGREIWRFPKKHAAPKLEVIHDTLTGTLHYAHQLIALGTMGYKHESRASDHGETHAALGRLGVNLKLIPDVDGRAKIAQLVGYAMEDIAVKGSWAGPARLHLVPHVNAPLADLPVRRIDRRPPHDRRSDSALRACPPRLPRLRRRGGLFLMRLRRGAGRLGKGRCRSRLGLLGAGRLLGLLGFPVRAHLSLGHDRLPFS
jgi:hypothetical protein